MYTIHSEYKKTKEIKIIIMHNLCVLTDPFHLPPAPITSLMITYRPVGGSDVHVTDMTKHPSVSF